MKMVVLVSPHDVNSVWAALTSANISMEKAVEIHADLTGLVVDIEPEHENWLWHCPGVLGVHDALQVFTSEPGPLEACEVVESELSEPLTACEAEEDTDD